MVLGFEHCLVSLSVDPFAVQNHRHVHRRLRVFPGRPACFARPTDAEDKAAVIPSCNRPHCWCRTMSSVREAAAAAAVAAADTVTIQRTMSAKADATEPAAADTADQAAPVSDGSTALPESSPPAPKLDQGTSPQHRCDSGKLPRQAPCTERT